MVNIKKLVLIKEDEKEKNNKFSFIRMVKIIIESIVVILCVDVIINFFIT